MNEIVFHSSPEKFETISNNLQTFLITNNLKNRKFAEKIHLNYFYNPTNSLEELKKGI